jgi:SAM-dependent methyltransferase
MTTAYAMKGGRAGRERLRVLSNIRRRGTQKFLDGIGVGPGMSCLDVGCGGGDVAREFASRIGVAGQVLGLDMDEAQLTIGRDEAAAHNVQTIQYRRTDITNPPNDIGGFDIVYTRFLLCHLPRPSETLSWMVERLKPGGVLAVEDVDFSGYFCHPPLPAFTRHVELCADVMRRRGGDPDIGLMLPALLVGAGVTIGGVGVEHEADLDGDVKLLCALNMETFADAIVAENLATRHQVDQLIAALHENARDATRFVSEPRTIQVWGRRLS